MFTWFDSTLSFDSAGSSAVKCEQDVNRKKKIYAAKVTLGYVRSHSSGSVGKQIIGDGTQRTTPLLICSFHIILYTYKVVNAKSDAFPLRAGVRS